VSLLIAAMSQEDGKANWNDSETLVLVDFLWEHRALEGDRETFKDAAFNAVADSVRKSSLLPFLGVLPLAHCH